MFTKTTRLTDIYQPGIDSPMKVGTIILKVGSFVMITETTLRFYAMPIQPFLIICTACSTFRTRGSDNVSLISATKDTRIPDQEEQLYLRIITRIPGDSYG